MDWNAFLVPALRGLAPYRPGITEEKLRAERGLHDIHKFSSNESPFPPPPGVLAAMQRALEQSNRYPDSGALLDKLARHQRVPADMLALGNGSIDVIASLVQAFVPADRNVVLSEYGYCAYPPFVTTQSAALRIAASGPDFGHDVDRLLEQVDSNTRMLIVDSPTNLSGSSLTAAQLEHLIAQLPSNVLLVLDEAYAEFADDDAPRDTGQLPLSHPNVVVTRTFSKAYGLAGLRIGYAIAAAGLIDALSRIRPPFPVSRVALAGATAALDDEAHLARVVETTARGRARLAADLRTLGATVVDSSANFVLADFGPHAAHIYDALLSHGFITRQMSAYRLPTHLRIAIGTPDEIDRLVDLVRRLVGARTGSDANGVLA